MLSYRNSRTRATPPLPRLVAALALLAALVARSEGQRPGPPGSSTPDSTPYKSSNSPTSPSPGLETDSSSGTGAGSSRASVGVSDGDGTALGGGSSGPFGEFGPTFPSPGPSGFTFGGFPFGYGGLSVTTAGQLDDLFVRAIFNRLLNYPFYGYLAQSLPNQLTRPIDLLPQPARARLGRAVVTPVGLDVLDRLSALLVRSPVAAPGALVPGGCIGPIFSFGVLGGNCSADTKTGAVTCSQPSVRLTASPLICNLPYRSGCRIRGVDFRAQIPLGPTAGGYLGPAPALYQAGVAANLTRVWLGFNLNARRALNDFGVLRWYAYLVQFLSFELVRASRALIVQAAQQEAVLAARVAAAGGGGGGAGGGNGTAGGGGGGVVGGGGNGTAGGGGVVGGGGGTTGGGTAGGGTTGGGAIGGGTTGGGAIGGGMTGGSTTGGGTTGGGTTGGGTTGTGAGTGAVGGTGATSTSGSGTAGLDPLGAGLGGAGTAGAGSSREAGSAPGPGPLGASDGTDVALYRPRNLPGASPTTDDPRRNPSAGAPSTEATATQAGTQGDGVVVWRSASSSPGAPGAASAGAASPATASPNLPPQAEPPPAPPPPPQLSPLDAPVEVWTSSTASNGNLTSASHNNSASATDSNRNGAPPGNGTNADASGPSVLGSLSAALPLVASLAAWRSDPAALARLAQAFLGPAAAGAAASSPSSTSTTSPPPADGGGGADGTIDASAYAPSSLGLGTWSALGDTPEALQGRPELDATGRRVVRGSAAQLAAQASTRQTLAQQLAAAAALQAESGVGTAAGGGGIGLGSGLDIARLMQGWASAQEAQDQGQGSAEGQGQGQGQGQGSGQQQSQPTGWVVWPWQGAVGDALPGDGGSDVVAAGLASDVPAAGITTGGATEGQGYGQLRSQLRAAMAQALGVGAGASGDGGGGQAGAGGQGSPSAWGGGDGGMAGFLEGAL
ncbi:hypothetical protein HYH03_001347 [Edaphochlamys debaryana]|uniref:Uncharacterized protein n=1 Tax=Edaphochlamys debaryana TaxID=47281 RepID=A0A836C6C8_9CHLO|nr:hypothetical protein HYH03_001347 [Edaphochlamys debaryana]|eukprot:KAG2500577.1 hypothetical protein HYH03_001347 [Edaphochlamys debaryana]